jgi:hypothetical protein
MPAADAPVKQPRRQAKMQRHHVADVCAKISAIKIVARLNDFALGINDIHMTRDQVKAADILLSRVVPVLQSVAHTDPDGNALTVQCVQFAGAPIADRHAAK